MLRIFIATFALTLFPLTATAQPMFSNPFADAAAYRDTRGSLPDATMRLRYEVTETEGDRAPILSELVIDVATDWSLARGRNGATLLDFRLNRQFVLEGDTFVSMNPMGDLLFRVMEVQNRYVLARMLEQAAPQQALPGRCDAEAELGVIIAARPGGSTASFRERRGVVTLQCSDRAVGSFTPSEGAAPPAAFWPTMFAHMTTHPALHRRVRASGRAPQQLETSFRGATGGPVTRTWRLTAVETVATPYPLEPGLRNTTAEAMDRVAAGAGQIGAEAVAGRAFGGAPTLESWTSQLQRQAQSEGEASAAMLLAPSFNMFPELMNTCAQQPSHSLCALTRDLRRIS